MLNFKKSFVLNIDNKIIQDSNSYNRPKINFNNLSTYTHHYLSQNSRYHRQETNNRIRDSTARI